MRMRTRIKKMISVLLIAAMTAAIPTIGVFAGDTDYVSINDTILTEASCAALFPDGSVSFDSKTTTLTLKDANISGDGYVINANTDLTVRLIGKNNVGSNEGTSGAAFMIENKASITFTGSGYIYASGQITGIMAEDIVASEDVSLECNGAINGIAGNVTVNDCAVVNAKGNNQYGVSNGSVTVNSGTLILQGSPVIGFQMEENTYSFGTGAVVMGGTSQQSAQELTGTYDLKTAMYNYLYVRVGAREIKYDSEGVSDANCVLDDNRLIVTVTPEANYTAEQAVYWEPSQNVVKKADALAGNKNKFVIDDVTAENIAIFAKKADTDAAPLLLKKTEDSAVAVSIQNDKAIATELVKDELNSGTGLYTGITYDADYSAKKYMTSAVAELATGSQTENSMSIGLGIDAADAATPEKAIAVTDEMTAAVENIKLTADAFSGTDHFSTVVADVGISVDGKTTPVADVTMSAELFDVLSKYDGADFRVKVATENADVYINSVATKELAELSAGAEKTNVNIKTTGSSGAAKAELQALSPNSTIWDAQYVKVVDENDNAYTLNADSGAELQITITDENASIPEEFEGTVIAAKGGGTGGSEIVSQEKTALEAIDLPDPFYFKDGAWCVDKPDGLGYVNGDSYHVKDKQLVVGAMLNTTNDRGSLYGYFSHELNKNYGKWIGQVVLSNEVKTAYVDCDFPVTEYVVNGKTYIPSEARSAHCYYLEEKTSNDPETHMVSDITTSPVGLLSGSWLDHADTSWFDAAKSEFVIDSAEELAGLAVLANGGNDFDGKTIELNSNIDLDAYLWTPVKNFKGKFDGNGAVITNMLSNGQYAALFKNVNDAEICNFKISGEARGTSNAAGVACQGTNTEFYNIDNQCNVWTNDNAGGICAYGSNISVKNCSNNGTIKAEQTSPQNSGLCAGGIAGRVYGGVFENLLHNGYVSGSSCGTILGEVSESTVIKNCYYTQAGKMVRYGNFTPQDCAYYNKVSGMDFNTPVHSPSGTSNTFTSLDYDLMNAWVDVTNASEGTSKYDSWERGREAMPFLIDGGYSVEFNGNPLAGTVSAKVITAKSGLLVFSAYDSTGKMTGVSVTGVAPSLMGQYSSPADFNNSGAAKIKVMLLDEAGFKPLCKSQEATL